MRERGKALNLAPVREYTVPCHAASDNADLMHMNQYLNLSTPPTNCIQLELDGVKVKRFNVRGSTDSLFPVFSARKGSRPLRLGSAEFIKPGRSNSDANWVKERRDPSRRPSSSAPTSIPGSLIVGSTAPAPARVKSGNMSPSVFILREQMAANSRIVMPPQHVSGRKMTFTSTERRTDVTSAAKERSGKFNYTHAAKKSNTQPIVRTATAMDFRDCHVPIRERMKAITLDVNNLGIQGTTFKASEEIVLYKNRRPNSIVL